MLTLLVFPSILFDLFDKTNSHCAFTLVFCEQLSQSFGDQPEDPQFTSINSDGRTCRLKDNEFKDTHTHTLQQITFCSCYIVVFETQNKNETTLRSK